MMTGPAIYAQLSDNEAVNAAVNGRIFPDQSPEVGQAYPALVYSADSLEIDRTFDGASGLAKEAITIACLASSAKDVATLAGQVLDALDDQTGTWGGIVVQGCFCQGQTEHTENVSNMGQDSIIYVCAIQFNVLFNRT